MASHDRRGIGGMMATKDISDYQVVRAYKRAMKYEPSGPFVYEILAQETGQPEKVCYRAMGRAERRGFIDFGVSLRTGWLTGSGKALAET